VIDVSRDWLSSDMLKQFFNKFPGVVRHVWIYYDYGTLWQMIERRDRIALALEIAETKMI
jgi:hypothetical protein